MIAAALSMIAAAVRSRSASPLLTVTPYRLVDSVLP
jgi:hypothetical protein